MGEILDVAVPEDYLAYHTMVPGLLGHPSVGNLGNSRLDYVNYVQEIVLNSAAIDCIEGRLDTLVTEVLAFTA